MLNLALRRFALLFPALLLAARAMASQAGFSQLSVPPATPDASPTTVVLYYPTQAPARDIPMGPFTPRIAFNAEPEASVKGLIILSHGTGGSELGHTSLAQALAENGYLVAALRHPGDNWQDRSLLKANPARYFDTRPRQATHVIDAVLRDPKWKDRISSDARGPRVGALGHSAGGYTVLALAGGQPEVARIAKHCELDRAADPIFCGLGGRVDGSAGGSSAAPSPSSAPSATSAPLADTRVRAVAALAPVGAVFTAASLAAIKVPTLLYGADRDRFLVPQFHFEWIAQNMPQAKVQRVANAWHFAFMDTSSMPINTEDGDAGADPAGFDRAAFLARLRKDLVAFFDQAFQ